MSCREKQTVATYMDCKRQVTSESITEVKATPEGKKKKQEHEIIFSQFKRNSVEMS